MGEKIKDFQPVAAPSRAVSAVYATAFTLVLTVVIGINQYFRGLLIDLDLTPTGTGTGTAYIADAIKKIRVRNEYGDLVINLDGGSGPGIAALLSHIANGEQAQTVFFKNLTTTSTTSYNSWWKWHMAARGKKFTIEVDIDPALMAGLTLSALDSTMGATIDTSDEPGEQMKLSVSKRVSPERISESGGLGYMVAITASELSGVLSSLSIDGKDLTTEQIRAAENATAARLVGLTTAGSAGAIQYQPGVASPNATTQLYALADIGEKPMDIAGVLGSAATIYLAKIESAKSVVQSE